MQQFRALFMLLIFLTSFGPCWAEQYCGGHSHGAFHCGMPHQLISKEASHVSSGESCSHDGDHSHDDFGAEQVADFPDNHPYGPGPHQQLPCQVCQLTHSGFVPGLGSFQLASPSYRLIGVLSSWQMADFESCLADCADEASAQIPPPNPDDPDSTLDLVTRTSVSVRGPNVN